MQEIVQGLEALNKQFVDFKEYNERELKEIKRSGVAAPETKEALERLEKQLQATEERVEKELKQIRFESSKPPESAETKAAETKELERKYWREVGMGNALPTEVKAIIGAVDTSAGYGVPETFQSLVIKSLTEFSPVRSVARVVNLTSGDTYEAPKRTAVVSTNWTAEIQEATETENTYGLEKIPVHNLNAATLVSLNAIEDSRIDLEAELRLDFVEQLAAKEAYGFVRGSGINQAQGFVNKGDEVKSGSNGDFDADDLIDLLGSLKEGYMRNAVFGFNRATMRKIRKLKANNQYIWAPFDGPANTLAGGMPSTILGRPWVIMADLADTGLTNAQSVVCGDFQRGYVIVDRVGMTIIRDIYTKSGANQVKFVLRRRVGGQVVLPEAIKVLKEAA